MSGITPWGPTIHLALWHMQCAWFSKQYNIKEEMNRCGTYCVDGGDKFMQNFNQFWDHTLQHVGTWRKSYIIEMFLEMGQL